MTHTEAHRLALVLSLAATLAACGSEEPASQFAAADPAGPLFAPDHVVEVAITMDPSDWDAMRRQTRTWADIMAAPDKLCLLKPFVKPFTWFPATITVDGVTRQVTVRKKGFLGSLNEERPALKVHFDGIDPEQSLYGLTRLTLNNSFQDPSWLRQCISYEVFAKADVPVPWCNFAHVTANGRDLGLYVHMESIDRRWVRRNFERDEGELWEGEESDFRNGWITSFEKKGAVEDDDQTKVDRSRLQAVADAVAGGVSDSEVRKKLSKLIDFEEFLRFWAVEKILEHWDGYTNDTNNFFLYHDPADDLFRFTPNGTDQITVPDPWESPHPPVSVYAASALSNRLYAIPETRALYAQTLQRMLDVAFREDELLAEVDRMQALVSPVLQRSGADVEAQAKAVVELRSWISGRRAVLLADLAGGPPEWRQKPKDSPCLDLGGTIRGSFTTTFGVDGNYSGRGLLDGTYRSRAVVVGNGWSGSRYDPSAQSGPWPMIELGGWGASDNLHYNAWMVVDPAEFHAGSTGPFDGKHASGSIGRWDPHTQQWTYLGGLVDGYLALDAAGTRPGAAVVGRFEAKVIRWSE